MRRLAPVPGEREPWPRGRRGRRLRHLGCLTADDVGAAGRRASSGGVEGRRAEDDVDGGRSRRGVVGVREAEAVKTGYVMNGRVTQPAQLTHGAVASPDRLHLKHTKPLHHRALLSSCFLVFLCSTIFLVLVFPFHLF